MPSASPKPAETALTSDDWRPFPFRRVLPISQLLLCAIILWPYRAWIGFELFGITPHYNAPRVSQNMPPVEFTLDADGKLDLLSDPQFRKRITAQDYAFDTVAALNLPGGIVQLPYAIYSEDHRDWIPGSIDFKTWRAVTWPLLSLPFWWMAGRGAEALASARRKLLSPRLRWLETLICFVLMAGGATMAIGLFFAGADPADPKLRLFATAGGMWGLLGSLTVVAKLAQWRIKKNAPAVVNLVPGP